MSNKEKLVESIKKLREAVDLIGSTLNYKSAKSTLDTAVYGIDQAIGNIQTAICDNCLSSLENWFSSKKYKEVENTWNIVTDLPIMEEMINSMAFEINTHRIEAAKNRNHVYIKHPNDIVQQYKDTAEEKRN